MTITYVEDKIVGKSSDRTDDNVQIGSVGGWKEIGRKKLTSASDTIDVTGLADKRYLMALIGTYYHENIYKQ
jgi:hypothetical protein